MTQRGDERSNEPQYDVVLGIACPKHGQVHDDDALLTEDSKRVVQSMLRDHKCPAGKYTVKLLQRKNGRKIRKSQYDRVRLGDKPNTITTAITFGSRTEDARRVEITVPEGVQAELVRNLLMGTAAKLKYVDGSQKVESVFDMVLDALQSSLCTEEYLLSIEEMTLAMGDDVSIQITGYRGDAMVGFVKPVGKPGYRVFIDCQRNPVREADKLFKAERAVNMYSPAEQLVHDMKEMQGYEQEDEEWQGLVDKICFAACYGLVCWSDFPEIPEKVAKQIFRQTCTQYGELLEWDYFRRNFLDSVGHKLYVPKDFIYKWLIKSVEDNTSIETLPEWLAVCIRVEAEAGRLSGVAEARKKIVEQHEESVADLKKTIERLRTELHTTTAMLKLVEAYRAKHAEGSRDAERLAFYEELMRGPFGELTKRLKGEDT